MRTHIQLKMFFVRLLIGLAALIIITGPVQVMRASHSQSPAQKGLSNSRATTTGSLSFLPVVTYDTGGFPASAVAVADLNGDGKPDLVAANSYACSPHLLHRHSGSAARQGRRNFSVAG